MANGICLSILLPTIYEHQAMFDKLHKELKNQCQKAGIWNEIEILFELDDRTMSIGNKRQLLLERSLGKFVTFIDADDWIPEDYCLTFWNIIKENPEIDCIGFMQQCSHNGQGAKIACLSNEWDAWQEKVQGFDYVRTPFFPNPIKREIAIQIGYRDMRFGEDKDFSDRLKASQLVKNEYCIDKIMYYYRYQHGSHEQKYGKPKK